MQSSETAGTGDVTTGYTYDAWGNVLAVRNGSGAEIAADLSHIANYNPIRYRSYYYDTETGFYYLQTRYYDPATGRFINADGYMSTGQGFEGYNMYAYCGNNPVMFSDESGALPKWVDGLINVVSGLAQMLTGATVGAAVGWTGIGAIAAGILIVNGAATATKGIGQIVNDVTDSNIMDEDNIIEKGVQEIGSIIGQSIGGDVGGKIGSKVAGGTYDLAVFASNLFAGQIFLEKSMPDIVESSVFSANDGYGVKIGRYIEMFYRNPNAAGGTGGTIFSYKGPLGKFRIDWDPTHGFHCHPPGH